MEERATKNQVLGQLVNAVLVKTKNWFRVFHVYSFKRSAMAHFIHYVKSQ